MCGCDLIRDHRDMPSRHNIQLAPRQTLSVGLQHLLPLRLHHVPSEKMRECAIDRRTNALQRRITHLRAQVELWHRRERQRAGEDVFDAEKRVDLPAKKVHVRVHDELAHVRF